jgi:membrane AbrB-like protein
MPHQLLNLMAAALAGGLFSVAGVPVPWLLGPMLAGIGVAALSGGPRLAPPSFMAVGQAVLGLTVGTEFPLETLKQVIFYAVPLLLAVIVTGGLSLLNGYLLWRWAGVDRATGFLGSLPGAAPSMVAMSEELGADPVSVAVLQYLRLLLVVFLAPPAVGYLFPHAPAGAGAVMATAGPPSLPLWLDLPLLALLGLSGAWLGRRFRLPSPTFLGPFAAALALSWALPYRLSVPDWAFAAGTLLVGLSIGLRFDLAQARKLGRATLVSSLLVAGLIVAGLLTGYLFHLLTGVDVLTAVLGSTPGGMDVMVASAVTMGGDAGLVLAMQMSRWFLVLLAGPWLAGRMASKLAEE